MKLASQRLDFGANRPGGASQERIDPSRSGAAIA